MKLGRPDTDFGRGFYTTTLRRQAKQWAWIRYYAPGVSRLSNQPVIIKFRVSREVLGELISLVFVRGEFNSLDYWSLVQHCRQSTPAEIRDHCRAGSRGPWYDLIAGPVSAFWSQRVAASDSDQLSFHTQSGVDRVLNPLVRSKLREDFDLETVVP